MKTNCSIFSQQASRLLLTVLAVCLLAACSKKDDPVPQTKTEFLTTGTWRISSFTSTDALVQSLGQLLVGTEYTFKTDGSLSYTVLGFPGGTGTWEFASSETRIIFNKGTQDENSSDIVTLDNGNMELKEVAGSITSTTKYTKK